MDPDFLAHMAAHSQPTPKPVVQDPKTALDFRKNFNAAIGNLMKNYTPVSEHIVEIKHHVKSYDGVEITVHEFQRDDWPEATQPMPAILYFHGGGLVSCRIEDISRQVMANFAGMYGVRVFGVEYRLAPEHPYPAALEDAYASLRWLVENAARLNIDPARVGLCGESAGGTLVAGLSLLARDRGHSPPLAKQLLFYPMLDDRSKERHFNKDGQLDQANEHFRDQVNICWEAYLGEGKQGSDDVSAYAAPGRAADLKGLPPTYIDVGTFDALRDEGVEFAVRLVKADVDVELHLYNGLPHGFDLAAERIPATLNAIENRRRFIKSL